MTTTSAASGGRGDAAASSDALRPDVPSRAEGVELIGEMPGSGYREPPALVRRADGQMLQLTALLYHLLHAVDGRRDNRELAEAVSASYGRTVTPENVAGFVDDKLRPLGLLLKADGSEPEVKRSQPLLGLQLRFKVTDPDKTRRLTAPFAALFNPVVATVVVAAFLAISWWALFEKGLASAAHEAFHRPGLLLLVFVVTVLSAGFHEFGHAAAARRGGATPGVMGMGLYLFWPAFYTDVTDSYRLGRADRLRTDLGGLYFNAIVAVGIAAVWWFSGYDALLLVIATQILQMVRQLLPMIRFDGYHVLADLTGVPDLYSRIKPVLLGALPWRWRDPHAAALKPWARAVVTLWVLVVVPVFLFTVVLMVLTLPRMIATAWVSLQEQVAEVDRLWGSGDVVDVLAHGLSIIALALPVLGICYLMVRLVRQVTSSTWRKTEGRPVRRALAMVLAAAIVCGLAWAWWPREATYRPIAAYEQGTLSGILPRAALGTQPSAGDLGTVQTLWPADAERPTRDHPSLAVVMVPQDASTTVGDAAAVPTPIDPDPNASPTDSPDSGPRAGVFPFDFPLPPEDGDTQALAVNTTDNTVVYDVAFALVWVDDETVDNTNEAFAAASCTSCAAVAVSFQVVFVMSDADVVIPANLATAVSYDCLECLTYALASQLVITLDGPLSDDSMAALAEVWAELAAFSADITSVPLDDIQDVLEGFQQQITEIILADPSAAPLDPGASPSAPGTAEVSPSGAPSATDPAGTTTAPWPTPGAPSGSPTGAGPSGAPTSGSTGSSQPTVEPSSADPVSTGSASASSPTP